MSLPVQKVALLGATGKLGSHILKALKSEGFTVTAVQRNGSKSSAPPEADGSLKIDTSSKDELTSAFKGQDAVVNAIGDPLNVEDNKAVVDAAIAAGVKRIVPSEYSTNLENPLSRKLPNVQAKVAIRDYITSVIPSTAAAATTWTSVNSGPFLDLVFPFGMLGPNLAERKATFHNGGAHYVGASRLADIGTAVARVLKPEHFQDSANKPVYIYSAAVSERYLTKLTAEVTGIDFGTVEDGRIEDLDTEQLCRMADEKRSQGDMSVMLLYYFQIMYGKGHEGDTRHMAWNERLGLKAMSEEEIKEFIRQNARKMGILQ
ncbi:Isoflavone reductase family protein [Lasiodiplodia theobromae]|uniref:Isoflavone reductase family protein n=1 Tax=Lasiodiplodia theobromae TaxID=45133 RepID=UPI0015C31730|nr:Isoflavone reductase family protein [Lasiodiplodia theobromae]KAF4539864.1 Isoflavone reductase family protein [Lasiodiplodia theobromae]